MGAIRLLQQKRGRLAVWNQICQHLGAHQSTIPAQNLLVLADELKRSGSSATATPMQPLVTSEKLELLRKICVDHGTTLGVPLYLSEGGHDSELPTRSSEASRLQARNVPSGALWPIVIVPRDAERLELGTSQNHITVYYDQFLLEVASNSHTAFVWSIATASCYSKKSSRRSS